jgi:hypothetical protein
MMNNKLHLQDRRLRATSARLENLLEGVSVIWISVRKEIILKNPALINLGSM